MQKFFYKFPRKFTGINIDKFVDEFYKYFSVHKGNSDYEFDLSDVEWMSNQELLILTSIFKYLVESKIKFKVFFLKNGSTESIERRIAIQIYQIWEVWKIANIMYDQKFEDYFDIHSGIVEKLKRRFKLSSTQGEIYNRFGITPFVSLDSISQYDNRIINEMLEETYRLSDATDNILRLHNCNMPFENHTLSSIITKELYENFLDHVSTSFFPTDENFAFLSLSLVPKLHTDKNTDNRIQSILEKNFNEESYPEFKDFYFDKKNNKYKNQSVLQFSFLDFGPGIISTLRDEYLRKFPSKNKENSGSIDSEILKWAFTYESSKDPIDKRYLEKTVIPRGLYDLISIVRRFNGLLIARSNYGKIYFDFSIESNQFNEGNFFGNQDEFFPGNLITIYLPERNLEQVFDATQISIPGILEKTTNVKPQANFINLFNYLRFVQSGHLSKGQAFSLIFDAIVEDISVKNKINYFDFTGYPLDENITKKIIHFLVSDYNINVANNIIVLNPPPFEFLSNLNNEILQLNLHVKNYRLHPIPFVRREDENLDIFWMGVYNKHDSEKLKDVFLEQNDLRKTDFSDPQAIVGNLNYFDDFGNLHSHIDSENIVKYINHKNSQSSEHLVKPIIEKYIKSSPGKIFLCPGNYYQYEYLQLFDAISNKEECKILADALLKEIRRNVIINDGYKIICATASSQQIANNFDFSSEEKPEIISLDHISILDLTFSEKIKKGDNVILVCDVLSTGYITNLISTRLDQLGAKLKYISVLVDAYDENFEPSQQIEAHQEKIFSVLKRKMIKYRRKDIKQELSDGTLGVIRINPFTNTPIEESVYNSPTNNRVLIDNNKFISLISETHVKAGYYKFNNLIHPYFFDMDSILQDTKIAKAIIIEIFSKLSKIWKHKPEIIFYPKGSAIHKLDFDILKSEVFKNHSISIFELERFQTNEGWRFPHPPKYMFSIAQRKKALIIDDGSCSGDSLMQMIDEITTLDVSEIVVVSIIGRLNDHKKDFFSRLNTMTGNNNIIPVSVYFGVQWHIPTYYIEESPIIREKQWLETLISIANLPDKIQRTANNILDELRLKTIDDESNKYLLKRKDGRSIIKELILVKEEIGKITSYRYYKEYFLYFDKFIKIYEGDQKTGDRYQMIEAICAVFLHEPNLFQKVKNILPDLAEKIEVFIQTILFGNPEKPNKPKLLKNNLFYKWSNKNIIHLFFIVHNGSSLFDQLSNNNIIELIKNFASNRSDLDYLFYRLLRFIPISQNEVQNKPYAGKIKLMVEILKESPHLDLETKKQIKRYSIFFESLPNSDLDFDEHLAKIKRQYSKIGDDRHHNVFIINDKMLISSQIWVYTKLKSNNESVEEPFNAIKKHWENISIFISNLLGFYKTNVQFFTFHDFVNDGPNETLSLEKMFGIVDESIHSEELTNGEEVLLLLNNIFDRFILENTETYKLFENISVQDAPTEFSVFLENIEKSYPNHKVIVNTPPQPIKLNIPLLYFNGIILKELLSNFRHSDESYPIEINWEYDENYAFIEIKNHIKKRKLRGGGQGINKLNSLNSFINEFKYTHESYGDYYIQKIKFSKI